MSLANPLGPRPALLEPPGQAELRTIVLDSPVLRAVDLAALLRPERTGWTVVDARRDVAGPEGVGGRPRARRSTGSSGEGLRGRRGGGADLLIVSDAAAGPDRIGDPQPAGGRRPERGAQRGRPAGSDRPGGRRRRRLRRPRRSRCCSRPARRPSTRARPWRSPASRPAAGATSGSRPTRPRTHLVSALDSGLRKVLARMGISTLAAYRGGHLFEVLGLSGEVSPAVLPGGPADGRLGRLRAARRGSCSSATPRPTGRNGWPACPTRAWPASGARASSISSRRPASGRSRPWPPRTSRRRQSDSRRIAWPSTGPSRPSSATCWRFGRPPRHWTSTRSNRSRRSPAGSSRRR